MDSNWIPNYFEVVSSDENYVNGYVASEEELSTLIEIHRRTFYCSFVYG